MSETVVRLAATTEEGEVVYVLANAKGELKLEEPIEVPGPPGPKGDPGDPFSGNFEGNVSFDGKVSASGNIETRRQFVAKGDSAAQTRLQVLLNNETTFEVRANGKLESKLGCSFTDKQVGFNPAGELLFFSRGQVWKAVAQNGNVMCEEAQPSSQLDGLWSEKDISPEIKPIQD